jgi:hypothetical protein
MNRAGHIRVASGLAAMLFSGVLAMQVSASGVVYRDYVVVRDQGHEVLCEPYRVKPDDFLLKLLRQKGEIAHDDFLKFTEIFRRLNPHVHDVDLIRPGQDILIPLKLLAKDAIAGQQPGRVAIPFVTLGNLGVPVKTTAYRVRAGDRVSSLVAQRFGGPKSQAFDKGMKRFKLANPQVADLNKIFVGQRLWLPAAVAVEPSGHGPSDGVGASDRRFSRPTESPPEVKHKLPATGLGRICSALQASLMARGTYYFPRPGKPDLALDASQFPIIELDGKHLLFASGRLAPETLAAIRHFWPGTRMVPIGPESSAADILDAISDPDPQGHGHHVVVTDGKVTVSVKARWRMKSPGQPPGQEAPAFINMLQPAEKPTDPGMLRFLAKRRIRLREIWPDGRPAFAPFGTASAGRLVHVQDRQPKRLVRDMVAGLGARLEEHVPVMFPYAGVQVKALSNLITGAPGGDCLVDFGDLYGDAASVIQKTGLRIVSIPPGTPFELGVKRLLAPLGLESIENPEFIAAPRADGYTTRVRVAGLLVSRKEGATVFLVQGPLPNSVADFLTHRGLTVIVVAPKGSVNGKESVQ